MEAKIKFFERYHGISSLLEKGMPSDVLFEGKTFNVENRRTKYIPYSCRCEAIGGGCDKGLLYRGLDGAWEKIIKENSCAVRRKFKLAQNMKGLRLYLVIDNISPKTTVYINGSLVSFCFDGDIDYIETEITAHVNFEIDNEIVIISEEINPDELPIMCKASIIARKFVHIRDYSCQINDNSVNLDIYMSRRIPAKVMAEVYDEELNLVATCEKEIAGEGKIKCDVPTKVRLILLVCGEEVIPIATDLHVRPDLPIGENISDYDTGSAREFTIDAVDIEQGIFDVMTLSECKNATLSYDIFAENGSLQNGESPLSFASGNVCRVMINHNAPSLSFYEYFIDFKVNGEFIGQFKLPVRQTACERTLSADMPAFFKCDVSNGTVCVSGVNFENVFNLEKGCFEKITKEDCDVLYGDSVITFGGVPAEHIRSMVMSRDLHHIGVSSLYSLKNDAGEVSLSVLSILYSDGEISISVSGITEDATIFEGNPIMFSLPVSDTLLQTKVYGEASVSGVSRAGVYDSASYSGEEFKKNRWVYSYGERVPGLFIKGMPKIDVMMSGATKTKNISPGITLLISPDENQMIATSFVIKAVFYENEDIIREARIIPFVML
ncbi:MAG: hypothetical protein E7384_06785 [Ruminococcaceae bacterium]|nr:hypothetical protein [Oscillospiraceae bacterium]